MRKDTLLVLDDWIKQATGFHYTSRELDERLGRYDQLAIFCELHNLTTTGGVTAEFYCFIEHSGDGETFVQKNGAVPVDSEVHMTWDDTAVGEIRVGWGSDPKPGLDPPTPLLRYVRLGCYLVNTLENVHVRIWVTQRDEAPPRKPGGGAP